MAKKLTAAQKLKQGLIPMPEYADDTSVPWQSLPDFTPQQFPAPVYEQPYDPGPADVQIYDDGGGGGDYGVDYGALLDMPLPPAPVAPPPPPKLSETPEWLAYLNALGLEESTFRADIDRRKGIYGTNATQSKLDLEPAYAQGRHGIAGSLAARGMSRSGELLDRLAQNRAAEGRAKSSIDLGLSNQLSDLESSLAQRLIDINARKASKEFDMKASGGYI
jgi:hypothetical protein